MEGKTVDIKYIRPPVFWCNPWTNPHGENCCPQPRSVGHCWSFSWFHSSVSDDPALTFPSTASGNPPWAKTAQNKQKPPIRQTVNEWRRRAETAKTQMSAVMLQHFATMAEGKQMPAADQNSAVKLISWGKKIISVDMMWKRFLLPSTIILPLKLENAVNAMTSQQQQNHFIQPLFSSIAQQNWK